MTTDDGSPKLPWLDEMRLHFAQEADTCAPSHDVQELDVLVTRGDLMSGFYYCLTTERWAIDDASEVVALLDRVKAAVAAASSDNSAKKPRGSK